MKQKKTVDANVNNTKPSIRKVGTILGSGALAVLTIGTICVFGLTSSSATQQDTKAAITNTTTAAVSEEKKESTYTYTSADTVIWRKASIGEYDISAVTTTAPAATETKATTTTNAKTTTKTTKTSSFKAYATDIVNLRAKADKNSEIVAHINKDDCVTVTAENGEWYTVKYGDYSGYVVKEYFTKTVPESVKAAETTKAETTTTAKATTTTKTTTQAQTTTKKATTTTAAQSNSETPVISFTDEEFDMLCYVLQGEVGYCSEESKMAVANVIINRVKSSQFPNSIEGVLTAPNQFTAIYGYYNRTTVPTQSTIDAAKKALYGEDNTNGAVFYYAPQYCGGSTASWFETLNFCMELEGQRFFKNW
ncbi:MAG: cell wall hydrolase [Hominimerdicola sp.]